MGTTKDCGSEITGAVAVGVLPFVTDVDGPGCGCGMGVGYPGTKYGGGGGCVVNREGDVNFEKVSHILFASPSMANGSTFTPVPIW